MKQAYVTLDVNRLLSIHGRFLKERIPEGEAKTSFLHFEKKHFMRANPPCVPYWKLYLSRCLLKVASEKLLYKAK